jgi:hypothetical protein
MNPSLESFKIDFCSSSFGAILDFPVENLLSQNAVVAG